MEVIKLFILLPTNIIFSMIDGKAGASNCIDSGITFCYPNSMKTAISVPDKIFKEVEKFAKKHNYSRSEVFVAAVRDLLKKWESKKLLDALNEAYSDSESQEEKSVRERGKKHYSKTILKERF